MLWIIDHHNSLPTVLVSWANTARILGVSVLFVKSGPKIGNSHTLICSQKLSTMSRNTPPMSTACSLCIVITGVASISTILAFSAHVSKSLISELRLWITIRVCWLSVIFNRVRIDKRVLFIFACIVVCNKCVSNDCWSDKDG